VVRAHLRGRRWEFLTDRGVFARGGVDRGTRLLAETMRIEPTDHVLDLGCGYGPLGLVAAALAPAGQAVLVDINARAVELARENARRHGLDNVEVLQGDMCAPVAGRRQPCPD
jgi:16S rRNA (guanine1207-N2)-methyltransferase